MNPKYISAAVISAFLALLAALGYFVAPDSLPVLPTPTPAATASPFQEVPTSFPSPIPTATSTVAPILTPLPSPSPITTTAPTPLPSATAAPSVSTPSPLPTPSVAPATSSPTPTPTPSPTSPPTIPYQHISTFVYYPVTTSCSQWAKYVSFAYPKGVLQYGAVHACGVKTIDYISPSMPQNGEDDLLISWGSETATQTPPPTPGPYYSVLSKDCSGNLVTVYNGRGYIMDPHPAQAAAYYQKTIDDSFAYIAHYNPGLVPDMVFSDNADSIYGASAKPCDYTGWGDWAQATQDVMALLNTHGSSLVLNTLANTTAYVTPPVDDTIANIMLPVKASTVSGAMLEDTFWGNKNTTGYQDAYGHPAGAWVAQQDLALTTIHAGKFFNVLANGPFTTFETTNGVGSAKGIQARLYVYASTLMTYDPTHNCGLPAPGCVLFGEEMSPPSGVDAYPEQGLLALDPVQSAKTTVNELRVGTSTLYAREFGACYYQATLVGRCATVVNTSNSASVPVDLPTYHHSLVLSGGAYLDGGSASFNGAQVTTLAPDSAAILFP